MEKLEIAKDEVNKVTYVKSKNKESDFTVDLLEHFLKSVLFEHTIYVFITFNKSMDQVSYVLLDIDVDNIHGYTIPYSELDEQDLHYVSVMGLEHVDEAIRIIKSNIDNYLDDIGNIKICLELPYDGVINGLTSTMLVNEIHRLVDQCDITIGSKYGKY